MRFLAYVAALAALFVAVMCMLPPPVFAQVAEAAPTPEVLEPGAWAIPGWLQAIIAVVCSLLSIALEYGRRYLNKGMALLAQKTKLAFLAQVGEVVGAKVSELMQIEAEALKEAAADGKLTEAEKEGLKQKAIDWAKSLLDPAMLADLFGGADKVDAGLGAVVESQVRALKKTPTVSAAVDPSKP
jgi:hypothetical protein